MYEIGDAFENFNHVDTALDEPLQVLPSMRLCVLCLSDQCGLSVCSMSLLCNEFVLYWTFAFSLGQCCRRPVEHIRVSMLSNS